jgi:hypothetical protein
MNKWVQTPLIHLSGNQAETCLVNSEGFKPDDLYAGALDPRRVKIGVIKQSYRQS